MKLYEISTGSIGVSYCRCYVFALSQSRAYEMFIKKNNKSEVQAIRELWDSSQGEMITDIDDEGWYVQP